MLHPFPTPVLVTCKPYVVQGPGPFSVRRATQLLVQQFYLGKMAGNNTPNVPSPFHPPPLVYKGCSDPQTQHQTPTPPLIPAPHTTPDPLAPLRGVSTPLEGLNPLGKWPVSQRKPYWGYKLVFVTPKVTQDTPCCGIAHPGALNSALKTCGSIGPQCFGPIPASRCRWAVNNQHNLGRY